MGKEQPTAAQPEGAKVTGLQLESYRMAQGWANFLGAYLVAMFLLMLWHVVLFWPKSPRAAEPAPAAEPPATRPAASAPAGGVPSRPAEKEKAQPKTAAARPAAAEPKAKDPKGAEGDELAFLRRAELRTRLWSEDLFVLGFLRVRGSPELRLILLVVVAGALGTLVHAGRSYVYFRGNRALAKSWLWWYFVMPLIGASLALIFFLLLSGGLLTGSARIGEINPYGVVGLAALVGMFAKKATGKLCELFDVLFGDAGDQKSRNRIDEQPPDPPGDSERQKT
jgi:hypothetical protein